MICLIMMTTNNEPRLILVIIAILLVGPVAAQVGRAPPPPEIGLGPPRVDLKMAIVMVLLVTVFFVLGFLSVYTRQCAQERFRARLELGLEAGAGPGHHSWASRGLDPDVIETFPVFVYSSVKGLKIGKGSLECAVCLCEFEDSETLRLIPKCDHVFHQDCVDAWLVSHSTCPVCRANLVPKPGDPTLAHFLNPVRPEPVDEPEPNRSEPAALDPEPARPPRSMSTGIGPGWTGRTGRAVPRSRSVGHLPLRPGESLERFTLRLPGEVRSQLVAGSGPAALPRAASTRRGFRSGSVRRKDGSVYERFDPDARWVFSAVPPFVSRSGSTGDDVASRHKAGSSRDEAVSVGERSSDALRPRDQV